MQSKNPFADALAKLMRSAVGMAQGAKEEFETVFSSMIDRWLGERDLVTREEFEALKRAFEDLKKENKNQKKPSKRTQKKA